MNLIRRLLPAILLTALAFGVEPRILRPADQSAIPKGPFTVIAKADAGAKLELDGKPLAVTELASGILSVTISAPAGVHELRLTAASGERKIRFAVGALENYKHFRVHPPAATCDSCHAARNGVWEMKNAVLEKTCSGCHNLSSFAKSHTHNTEVLNECQMCHNPHGSTETKHLVLPKITACKQCHG